LHQTAVNPADFATNDLKCVSLPAANTDLNTNYGVFKASTVSSQACRRMRAAELSQTWVPKIALEPTAPFGHASTAGDFFVELTDPAQAQPPSGYDIKLGLCFARFTVTAIGMTYPSGKSGAALFNAEGQETARARITAGPIRCAL